MKITRLIAVTAIIFSISNYSMSTPQYLTPLKYKGNTHYVYNYVLSDDMVKTFLANRHKLRAFSTANVSGIYQNLDVRNERLYITNLDIERSPKGRFGCNSDPSIRTMFGVTVPRRGIFAEWFTGELEEPIGRVVVGKQGPAICPIITEESRYFIFENGILKAIEVRKSTGSQMIERTRKLLEDSTNNVH